MASHGVPRVAETPIRTEEERQEELKKIEKYEALVDQIHSKVDTQAPLSEILTLTTSLLQKNPEYYTIWNMRRRCLTAGWGISSCSSKLLAAPSSSKSSPSGSLTATSSAQRETSLSSSPNGEAEAESTTANHTLQVQEDDGVDKERVISDIKTDLEFVVPLLKKWPKCYWIWNHRIWLLQQATQLLSTPVARKLWSNELALCSMMLTRDSRNFHGWGYRFMVVSQLESEELEGKSMVEQEFAYTTRMVHTSLSNFSAWHHRSKLIPRLLSERNASAEERKQMLDEELELMHQALWTDPEDQSLWFYHHFLISTILSTDPEVTFTPDLGIEEREEVVRGQNEGLKEMIDGEEPKWIYSALWEYTVGMARMLGREPSGEEKEEMRSWLGHLRRLDPTREGRWRDWEVKLRL